MRSFQEIKNDARTVSRQDEKRVAELVQELKDNTTPEAKAERLRLMAHLVRLEHKHVDAIAVYRQSLELFEKLGDIHACARVSASIGGSYEGAGDFSNALNWHERALELYKSTGELTGIAQQLRAMGVVYFEVGEFTTSLASLYRSLDLYKQLEEPTGIADVIAHIGNNHANEGLFVDALEAYEEALVICEEHGLRKIKSMIVGNMSIAHSASGNREKGIEYLERGLELERQLGREKFIAMNLNRLAISYFHMEMYEKALPYNYQALKIFEQIGLESEIMRVKLGICHLYVRLGRLDEAKDLLEEADKADISIPMVRMSRQWIHAEVKELDGDLEGAHEDFLRLVSNAQKYNLRWPETDIHKFIRDLAKKRGDFEAYVKHNDEHHRLKDELRENETSARLAVQEQSTEIRKEREERERERAVLYSTLPKKVADRIVRGETVSGDHYDDVSVIFVDIAGFTSLSDQLPPGSVVQLLEKLFVQFDESVEQHQVTKIKTIGDSYMAVAFPSEENEDSLENPTLKATKCALDMLRRVDEFDTTFLDSHTVSTPINNIRVRIGLHVGPVTAGVIGTQRLQYDVWGDTVNVASRMESTGEPGKVHVSEAFAKSLSTVAGERSASLPVKMLERGSIDIKGKGTMTTYWLEGA